MVSLSSSGLFLSIPFAEGPSGWEYINLPKAVQASLGFICRSETDIELVWLAILKDRMGGLGEGSRGLSCSTNVALPRNPSLSLSCASLCIFFPLLHVASTFLNKDNDLFPVNIYKISKGINFIDFHPLAHIWSSHCGQRLTDLYLTVSLADLTVEAENPSVHMELEGSTPRNTAGGMKDIGQ